LRRDRPDAPVPTAGPVLSPPVYAYPVTPTSPEFGFER
jgi:hypothetical protein